MSEPESDPTDVWIKTTVSADGKTYVVTLEASREVSVDLTPQRAQEYAGALYATIARAEHMTAIMRQMIEHLDLDRDDARNTVLALHEDLPPIDRALTDPMFFHPAVGRSPLGQLVPLVITGLAEDGQPRGQWDVATAKEHAQMVLDAVEAANLDSAYYRMLRGMIDKNRARAAVADLANYR
jgi:hypothetical protein